MIVGFLIEFAGTGSNEVAKNVSIFSPVRNKNDAEKLGI